MENLNSARSIKGIEFIIKSFTEKTTSPDGFSDEFNRTFKSKIIPFQNKLFQNYRR